MAIYHFSAKLISRARGSSAVAAAAYRSASRLHDARLDRAHDFTNKAGVVHSEVMLPPGAPEAWRDRGALWNAVEAREARKDAQLAREVEFALPRELTREDAIALAREFVQAAFVDRGMVADLNVHWDLDVEGQPKPHAHVMLSLRRVGPDGFGAKVRDWNRTALLETWREAWAEQANARLAQLDLDARIDHRSLAAQGLALEPQDKIGPAGVRRGERGETADRAWDHRDIAWRNGQRILADPSIALAGLTHQQSTFTEHDLLRFAHRHSDGVEQFDAVVAAIREAPDRVRLGLDGAGRTRFTSREMLQVEAGLVETGDALEAGRRHGVGEAVRRGALETLEGRGLRLSETQAAAFDHVTDAQDLSLVVGYAGSGKSAMLGAARMAWEAEGYRVRGLALSGIAAASLEASSGVASRTLASQEHSWAKGRDGLGPRDVLVVDEAGLVGSRQLGRVMAQVRASGAKLVLVGDPQQLQAIEAGAAFRALAERHGAVEITEVVRQRDAGHRQAVRELATGRTGAALERFAAAGDLVAHPNQRAAEMALVQAWATDRAARPDRSQLLLAFRRDDVGRLNALARAQVRAAGGLGPEQRVKATHGELPLAVGEQVMFLRNERSLGVKNGSLGTLRALKGDQLSIDLDEGRQVRFGLGDYRDLTHGYAATIHKAQGATVDRAYVLATGHMDAHATYVALSRHREAVRVSYSAESFGDLGALARQLGRVRTKDVTLDYLAAYSGRRGLSASPDHPKLGAALADMVGRLRSLDRAEAGPSAERASRAMIFAAERLDRLWPDLGRRTYWALRGQRDLLDYAHQARPSDVATLVNGLEAQARQRERQREHDRDRGRGR